MSFPARSREGRGNLEGLHRRFRRISGRGAIDLKGDFLCPGLIDGHVHIESSMVTIPEFARAVLPNGTTTVVIDPHEIANVLGSKASVSWPNRPKGVPLNVFVMIPSCVPATHHGNLRSGSQAQRSETLLQGTLGPRAGRDDELSRG